MPSTRGRINPTPGASTSVAGPQHTPNAAPIPAPSGAGFVHSQSHSDSELEGEESAFLFVNDSQEFVEPSTVAASAGGGGAKKSTAKLTSDVRWTTMMEEKLVSTVLAEKAYIKTDITMAKKFDIVKAKLILDRDFMSIVGMADKSGQAFEKKFKTLLKSFRTRHALDNEGANLSGLDGDTMANMNRLDAALYAISLEIEHADEKRRVLTEKEKHRNKAMLVYEADGLSGRSLSVPAEVTVNDALSPADELTASSRGGGEHSGFISRYAQSSADITLSENSIKLQEAKNEELRLQLQLKQMEAQEKQQSTMEKLIEQHRDMMNLLASNSPSKRRKQQPRLGDEWDDMDP